MDFLHLGKHCTFCKQQDFLPFKCGGCNDFFCLEHRTFENHNCPTVQEKKLTITCPECECHLKIQVDEDTDFVLAQHMSTSCKSLTKKIKKEKGEKKKSKRPKCKQCKKRCLIRTECKDCKQCFCIAHLNQTVHHCKSLEKKDEKKDTIAFLMSLGDARVTQITKSAVERRKAIANQVKKTRLPPAILVK
jgi:predicted nucleic acid binding AN1-type Zn finger protein